MKINRYLVIVISVVIFSGAGSYYYFYDNNFQFDSNVAVTKALSGAGFSADVRLDQTNFESLGDVTLAGPGDMSKQLTGVSKNEETQPTDDFFKAIESDQTVVTVTPTKEQNETFEQLKINMEDHFFIQNLTMQELLNMEEMQSLPVALQYVIISKAMTKYNNGEINKENFMSQR